LFGWRGNIYKSFPIMLTVKASEKVSGGNSVELGIGSDTEFRHRRLGSCDVATNKSTSASGFDERLNVCRYGLR